MNGKLCIKYERDTKLGRRLQMDTYMVVRFGRDIPKPGDKFEGTIQGIDKNVEVIDIQYAEWKRTGKGLIGVTVHMKIRYWSDENGVLPEKNQRPKLTIIKGGGGDDGR